MENRLESPLEATTVTIRTESHSLKVERDEELQHRLQFHENRIRPGFGAADYFPVHKIFLLFIQTLWAVET